MIVKYWSCEKILNSNLLAIVPQATVVVQAHFKSISTNCLWGVHSYLLAYFIYIIHKRVKR